MNQSDRVKATTVLAYTLIGEPEAAWELVQAMTPETLAEFEAAVTEVRNLIEARKAADVLIAANQPHTPP